jgi:nitroreductase
VALCPGDAIVHKDLEATAFHEVRKGVVRPDDMKNLLLSRRSIRAFKEKPVPGEIIEQLIQVATHAGSASNAQSEGFVVIRDRHVVSELEKMVTDVAWAKLRPLGMSIGRHYARIRYGEELASQSIAYYESFKARRDSGRLAGWVLRDAPAVIVVHGKRNNLLARENCAIATRNMEMLAETWGLGTCWAGFLLVAAGFTKKIAGSLGISRDRNIYSAIMVGYPKYAYRKTVPRAEREVRWM